MPGKSGNAFHGKTWERDKSRVKLDRLVSQLSEIKITDVGYEFDEPIYVDGRLGIPIKGDVDMSDAVEDFRDAISRDAQRLSLRPSIEYQGIKNIVVITPDYSAPADLQNYSRRFIEAYGIVLERQRRK